VTHGSPEGQEEAVRRLLAESGGAEPLPPEVAARLDATLARLVEQRDEIGPDADLETETLMPLRRQRWPKLLLAAAAVMVAGYGVATVVQNGSLTGDSDSGASGSATSGLAASATPQQESNSGGQGSASDSAPAPTPLRAGVVPLHSGHLTADVRRLLGRSGTVRLPKEDTRAQGLGGFRAADRCAPRSLPAHSTWTTATYDDRPAVLVLRPIRRAAEGHSVVAAEVRSCSGTLLDSVTVRVR